MSTGPEIPRTLRAAFRLPERLYRSGLGPLLGRRFLRLSHRGRRSGAPYATVLEVVAYDGRRLEMLSSWSAADLHDLATYLERVVRDFCAPPRSATGGESVPARAGC